MTYLTPISTQHLVSCHLFIYQSAPPSTFNRLPMGQDDQCESDYFPIFIDINKPIPNEREPKWQLHSPYCAKP